MIGSAAGGSRVVPGWGPGSPGMTSGDERLTLAEPPFPAVIPERPATGGTRPGPTQRRAPTAATGAAA